MTVRELQAELARVAAPDDTVTLQLIASNGDIVEYLPVGVTDVTDGDETGKTWPAVLITIEVRERER